MFADGITNARIKFVPLEVETRRRLGRLPFLREDVEGKSVLLHVCCAPDATVPVKSWSSLAGKLACYFYDPNIYPPEEYLKRVSEMRKLAQSWQIKMIEGKYFNAPVAEVETAFVTSEDRILANKDTDLSPIKLVDELEEALRKMMEGGGYEEVAEKLKPLAGEPEGGARCALCFDLRLARTSALAKILGFSAFATTLTISPKKDADMVNFAGERAGKRFGVDYIWTNFKKAEGFKRSIQLSKELSLYRQSYCGCKWSKGE